MDYTPAAKIFLGFTIALLMSACATAKVVSTSSSGPTISQAQAEPYTGPKKRIAVKAFVNKTGRGGSKIGKGMSDMLADALVNSNRFIVLEREHIKDVLDEQDFGASGRVKKETAAAIGEIEGAQLLIRGSITQFEPNCSGGSVIVFSAKKACLSINLRIVDAKTGRVVNATTVDGRATNIGGGLVFVGNTLPFGLGGWKKTPMEAALRNMIEKAVHHIISQKL